MAQKGLKKGNFKFFLWWHSLLRKKSFVNKSREKLTLEFKLCVVADNGISVIVTHQIFVKYKTRNTGHFKHYIFMNSREYFRRKHLWRSGPLTNNCTTKLQVQHQKVRKEVNKISEDSGHAHKVATNSRFTEDKERFEPFGYRCSSLQRQTWTSCFIYYSIR